MFIVNTYALAVVLCVITMLCWGSWGNTQKLAAKSWRYELFYWDYVIGMVFFALLLAFTAGSIGTEGRPFLADLKQASTASVVWILVGGIIFNASNILLSASVSLAGMSVAFPVGVGLALVLGVFFNYLGGAKDENAFLLFLGVALVVVALVCNGIASARRGDGEKNPSARKGIVLAIIAGVLMSLFYSFVVRGMSLNLNNPDPGMVTPYSAIVLFTLGVLISNFLFNTIVMKKPFIGEPVTYKEYFAGNMKTHLVGVLGGSIWCLGTALSYLASGKAGAAISYGLGQGAPMIAAIWGIFIWKEFKDSKKPVGGLLALMFVFFIAGLGLIILAR